MGTVTRVVLALVLTFTLCVAAAEAADTLDAGPNGERVKVSLRVTPREGPLYRTGDVPVNLRVGVEVTAPYDPLASRHPILPSKRGMVRLPSDLDFRPAASLSVCTDREMNSGTNLSIPPRDAIALCPGSVIGNGTADMYLAGTNLPGGPSLRDVVLIIFHAGRTPAGQPKIKIYGYSKGVNAGVLMQGTLRRNGVLAIDVPVLPLDTAIGRYDLNVPGSSPVTYNGEPVPGSVGRDPGYVRARCSKGSWRLTAVSTLGARQDDGTPTSPDYLVRAPEFVLSCEARPGGPPAKRARFGRVLVKGPKRVVTPGAATYRVTVRNTGSAVAAGVRIVATGRGVTGSARVGDIPPGRTRTVAVKVRLRKGGRVGLVFTVSGRNVNARSVTKRVAVG